MLNMTYFQAQTPSVGALVVGEASHLCYLLAFIFELLLASLIFIFGILKERFALTFNCLHIQFRFMNFSNLFVSVYAFGLSSKKDFF